MKPKILFEDESLMVITKPSSWITNSASTTKNQPVIQDWVRDNFEFQISKNNLFRNGIVHRLDKETSGILLIAKTEEAFDKLQSEFKERNVKKTYLALVHGIVEPDKGVINVSVGRLPWRRDRFGIVPGGRDSITDYKVTSYFRLPNEKREHLVNYSLVECKPGTGRTHQIRIHMKHIGHPVVSDEFYTGRKTARVDRKWCPRLFLHASEIVFMHPLSKKRMEYTSSLEDDLVSALKSLEKL